MIFFSLFVLLLVNFQVQAEDSCNDGCLTKTYCMSSDGSGNCTENNLIEAQFKVIPGNGEFGDYLQLILKGNNVAANDVKTIKLAFDRPSDLSNLYICDKSLEGTTASFSRVISTIPAGSSYYENGVLYCNWTFTINDSIWPSFSSGKIDLTKDKSQSIRLVSDSKQVIVAEDTSELPIYYSKHLKCCNIINHNEKFSLSINKVDNLINYRLYYRGKPAKQVIFILTHKDGIKIQHNVALNARPTVSISNGAQQFLMNDKIANASMEYSWSTPIVLGDSTLSIDVSKNVFELEVQIDGVTIHVKKDFVLKETY